jgi:hypothetical protein
MTDDHDPRDLSTAVEREVVALHEFFEAWLRDDDPDGFDRVADALAPGFHIVSPDGTVRGYDALVASLRAGRGSQPPGFAIEVRDVRVRDVTPHEESCLVTYEEWQRGRTGDGDGDGDGDAWTGRLSTALFGRAPDAPGGVEWRHVHETWLPDAGPGAGAAGP